MSVTLRTDSAVGMFYQHQSTGDAAAAAAAAAAVADAEAADEPVAATAADESVEAMGATAGGGGGEAGGEAAASAADWGGGDDRMSRRAKMEKLGKAFLAGALYDTAFPTASTAFFYCLSLTSTVFSPPSRSQESYDSMRAVLLPEEGRAKLASLEKAFDMGNLAEDTYRKMKEKFLSAG